MKKVNLLSKAEMKKVMGGLAESGYCSITLTCGNANQTNLSITGCNGSCSSGEDYVKCKGPTKTLTKWCDGSVDNGGGEE